LLLAASAWAWQRIEIGWLSWLAARRVEEIQPSDVPQRVHLGHAQWQNPKWRRIELIERRKA